MALGKAFIEVHADTKPFARELGLELNRILNAAERDVRAGSTKLGSTIARETGKGVERNRKQLGEGIGNALTGVLGTGVFSKFAKGIVDSIDDGLSGLPAEIKVILGAALLAALPLAYAFGSALVGAITAGLLTVGTAAIGALIAAQFVEVQDAAQRAFSTIRTQFLEGARFLVRPFINAIDEVARRFRELQPVLIDLFDRASQIIAPLTDALLGFVEQALPGLAGAFENIGPFLVALQVGLRDLGEVAGDFFQTIANNENAPDAFADLIFLVSDLIALFTGLVSIGLDFYGTLRDIAEFLGLIDDDEVILLAKAYGVADLSAGQFGETVEGTIDPLEAENQAIEDLNQSIALLTKLTFAQIDNQIAFEQGIDDLTESIKENGRTLDIHSQAGRDNASALLDLTRTILQTRADTIELTGDVAAAETTFRNQRNEIYRVARQMGLSRTAVDNLIEGLLAIPAPRQAGVTSSSLSRLEDFNRALQETIYLQSLIDPTYNPRGPGGQQKFAHGGIVTGPTNALIGEAGAEAVIPLTNPARAAQLLNQSGLSQMMGTNVNVYIGNQQIDAYIDTRVNQAMATTARGLSYGGRAI